jgi:hypothetical protein
MQRDSGRRDRGRRGGETERSMTAILNPLFSPVSATHVYIRPCSTTHSAISVMIDLVVNRPPWSDDSKIRQRATILIQQPRQQQQ